MGTGGLILTNSRARREHNRPAQCVVLRCQQRPPSQFLELGSPSGLIFDRVAMLLGGLHGSITTRDLST